MGRPQIGDFVRIKPACLKHGYPQSHWRFVGRMVQFMKDNPPYVVQVYFFRSGEFHNVVYEDLEVAVDFDPVMDALARQGEEDAFA